MDFWATEMVTVNKAKMEKRSCFIVFGFGRCCLFSCQSKTPHNTNKKKGTDRVPDVME
jgi:hypothetical protein